MGMPWFEIQRNLRGAGVVALSANFALYGDMSGRVMSVAAGLGPTQEVYSIDECFIGLHGMRGDMTARCDAVRQRIRQWIGIPCGIGIGRTKTLAKLANYVAKTADRKPGSYPADLAHVCNLEALPQSDRDAVLQATELGEVWGIGRRIGDQLRAAGLSNALDVARLDPAMVRRRWNVVLERTVRELQGFACIELEDEPPPRKEIACTRSFGYPVRALKDLAEAVTDFVSRAAEKLRAQDHHACRVLVFIHTSPFRRGEPQYSKAVTVPLRLPTSDSAQLVRAALHGLRAIYREGFNFSKAGIHLLELEAARVEQKELPLDDSPQGRDELMTAMDRINAKYGHGSLYLASAGTAGERREWLTRRSLKTPEYTTRLEDLPTAIL
ncbi:MAG: Y-family DNA polymerase [Oxalobacteraceae bacterium]|nr:MAG: Y-family DNA polymerase [Oxalobacteraceae bacterium]